MRSFEEHKADFTARNAEVVVISVDSPEESRKLSQAKNYTLAFASDPDAKTIRTYGVLHEHAGENGRDIARPAEFLVDQAGIIRWENLSDSILARLHPEAALQAIDQIR